MDEWIVGHAGLATYVGWKSPATSNRYLMEARRARRAGEATAAHLPEPDSSRGRKPVWSVGAIDAWLSRRPKGIRSLRNSKEGFRTCSTCSKEKPVADYPLPKRGRHGGVSEMAMCRACVTAKRATARHRDVYGLTDLQVLVFQAEMQGTCMICGEFTGKMLVIDHDHTTGSFRGLLCNRCNLGLALFRDNPSTLLKAARYLVRSKNDSIPIDWD